MALPLTETDKFLLLSAVGAPETRDRIAALLDLAGTGNMTGPASATDNAVVRFDGATGALTQNSGVIVSDADAITGVTSLNGITSATLAFVDFTSSGQTQLNSKAPLASPTFSGQVLIANTAGQQLTLQDGGTAGVNSDPYLRFNDNTTEHARVGVDNAASLDMVVKNLKAGALNFYANNTLYSSISSAGLVTIGASGGTQAHVVNGSLTAIASAGPQLTLQDGGTAGVNANPHLTLKDGTQDMGYFGYTADDLNLRIQNTEAGPITFYTSNTEYGSISSAGLFTIGSGTSTTHRINSQLATAAADVLTFTNGPTGTAGNPDVYLQININGTNYAIPAFAV